MGHVENLALSSSPQIVFSFSKLRYTIQIVAEFQKAVRVTTKPYQTGDQAGHLALACAFKRGCKIIEKYISKLISVILYSKSRFLISNE